MVELTDSTRVSEVGARWLRSRHAGSVLAVISFAESVFAPILIDPFLIALILASPQRWKLYTVISIVASVIGGICAYLLGIWFFDTIGAKLLAWYELEASFAELAVGLGSGSFMFVLIGAITPIPYKLVALASGVAQISLGTFIFASILGRIIRLGAVGMTTHLVGPQSVTLVKRHMRVIGFGLLGLTVVYIIIRFWI